MNKRVGKCLQLVKSWFVGQGQTLEREEERPWDLRVKLQPLWRDQVAQRHLEPEATPCQPVRPIAVDPVWPPAPAGVRGWYEMCPWQQCLSLLQTLRV